MMDFFEISQIAAVGGGMVFAFVTFSSPHPQEFETTAKVESPKEKPTTTSLVVSLSQATVSVKQLDKLIAKYPVAVGRDSWETPTGHFQVTDMQVNPAWRSPFTGKVYSPGVNNPIGDRWIEFLSLSNGNKIGFHGTQKEYSVGRAVSSGCLRMRRSDLHKLYAAVKIGTPVIVEQ
jgi:lipoprotein-anchoring transpeptidase ErfK/SrfK